MRIVPIRPLYFGRIGGAEEEAVADDDAAAAAVFAELVIVGWICSLTLAVSRGSVRNSAEQAAIAEAANDLCKGSGGPLGGGLIFSVFLFFFFSFSIWIERVEREHSFFLHFFSLSFFLSLSLSSRALGARASKCSRQWHQKSLESLPSLLLLLQQQQQQQRQQSQCRRPLQQQHT